VIARYVQAAAEAPLRDRPSLLTAEIGYAAEQDRGSLFAAALVQLRRCQRTPEQELAL
jgi:hypothetical protein